MTNKETRYESMKKLVQQKQGRIHSDILRLPEDEQIFLFNEALEEGTILGETEIRSLEEELEKRILLAKQLALLIS